MKALITGISGQDGYFLAQFLLGKNYEVHGIIRRNGQMKIGNLELLPGSLQKQINIHYGDVTDSNFIENIVSAVKPDELYHLAAQSFVAYSFKNPAATYDVNIGGTLNIVNAIKDYSKNTKLYFASTSELYGKPNIVPQNENTPFYPRSPYAISKLAAYWTVKTYRDAYSLFMSNGILFNHESEVRGPEFVTRKISLGVARIYHGSNEPIELGNLDAIKDWGYAKDYVEGMWKILNYDTPDDFVLGTGKAHTVREFIEKAFKVANINIEWQGSGLKELGVDKDSGKIMVTVNEKFYRPLESDNYLADYSKAKQKLGWTPKTDFEKLVQIMVDYDIKHFKK